MVLTGVGLGFLLDPKWLRINILISKNGKIVIFFIYFFLGGTKLFLENLGGYEFFMHRFRGANFFPSTIVNK